MNEPLEEAELELPHRARIDIPDLSEDERGALRVMR